GHDRRVARRPAVHGLEGVGLHGEGRVRSVLRRPVHAGAEPHGDRGMTPAARDYPRITVPPPGPKAREIVARHDRYASTSLPKEYPLVVARGERAVVEDVDGNRYLDFMAGIAVASTGYGHPKVVKAIQDAAARFLHICGADFYYEGYAALLERLATLAPGTSKKRVFLSNSGAEAVEGAIKLARHSTGRPALVAFTGAFHGRTYGAISLTASKASIGRGSVRSCRRSTTSPMGIATAAASAGMNRPAPWNAWRTSSTTCSLDASIPATSPPWWSSRFRGRAATSCHPPVTCAPCASCAIG